MPSVDLDERYGRTARRRQWDRRWLWVGGIGMVFTVAAWVVWAGFDSLTDSVDTLDVGFSIVDDTAVNVTLQVTLPLGTTASCALQAQNEAHGIVGWKIIDIAASDVRTRSFTESVRTTELAVTGLIYRCWLT